MYLEKEELKNAAKAARIVLTDDVNDEMLMALSNWFNLLKKPGEIWINTYGGEAGAARAIIGFLNIHKKSFKFITGLGQVFSAGAGILISVELPNYMEKNSNLLFHQAKTWAMGKESATDAKNTVESLEWENKFYKNALEKKINDINVYKKIAREIDEGKDVIFSAQEALKYGLITKII